MQIDSASLRRPPTAEAGEFVPFTSLTGDPASGYVVICDHADHQMPREYGNLGLSAAETSRHIAYDPGAAALARKLARRLASSLVCSTFSRLLIDPNRGEDDPTLIMRISDGAVVPGNRHVDTRERQHRIARYYAPYHGAVAAAIDAGVASGNIPALISVHSYTPVWRGNPRPWHAAILWDRDPRLPVPLIAALRRDRGLIIGDNEPYTGALAHDTVSRHAESRGIAHALIEIRQDLIADERGVEAWAARLGDILVELNPLPGLHEFLSDQRTQ
jgi:predicted N-formylglutamate amidohydrolase